MLRACQEGEGRLGGGRAQTGHGQEEEQGRGEVLFGGVWCPQEKWRCMDSMLVFAEVSISRVKRRSVLQSGGLYGLDRQDGGYQDCEGREVTTVDTRAMVHAPAGRIHGQGGSTMTHYGVELQEMSPMGHDIYTRLRQCGAGDVRSGHVVIWGRGGAVYYARLLLWCQVLRFFVRKYFKVTKKTYLYL